MYLNLNMVLVGAAALGAASPIAYNIPFSARSTKPFPANSTIGTTPTNSTQKLQDLVTELYRCNWEGFQECIKTDREDCDAELHKFGACSIPELVKDLFGKRPKVPGNATIVYGDGHVLGSDKKIGDA